VRGLVPFTAQTRMSGMDLPTAAASARAPGDSVRVGEAQGGHGAAGAAPIVEQVSNDGATPLVVVDRTAGGPAGGCSV
jgi:K+-transporting ATPase ATPase B chain